jgi:putative iron-dependent peroxidase
MNRHEAKKDNNLPAPRSTMRAIAPQPGILLPIPPNARYLTYSLKPGVNPRETLRGLRDAADGERVVAGIGVSLVRALDGNIEGLRAFPSHAGAGFDVPSTPSALWIWVRGEDRGELFHRSRLIERKLVRAFRLEQALDAFRHDRGRDLTGYEDGTENPRGGRARRVAIVQAPSRLQGSSFVAVQQWEHHFGRFEAMTPRQRDDAIGRRRSSNEEIAGAPPSAHVKRTAQENFEPAAFVVRRSMPWADAMRAGLVFVAFGCSLDAFEAQLRRMVGLDDGITDALFKFTRPVTGAYYWCPGMRRGRLDLAPLGL